MLCIQEVHCTPCHCPLERYIYIHSKSNNLQVMIWTSLKEENLGEEDNQKVGRIELWFLCIVHTLNILEKLCRFNQVPFITDLSYPPDKKYEREII